MLSSLTWRPNSVKNAFLITDAPGHGRDICDWGDDYPDGSPEGHKLPDQMAEMARRQIHFTMVKVNERCNMMIKVMQDSYGKTGMTVSDLAEACQNQTKEQVNQKFIKSASFILSASIAGKQKARAKAPEPLWDVNKLEKSQWFSQKAYLQVKKIEGKTVTVSNQFGEKMFVSRDILEGMESASHFKKVVGMTMTGLAEILHKVQDHVFTVNFRRQPSTESVE